MSTKEAKIHEETFRGHNRRELFLRALRVESPKGVVVIIHGFGEHSGRYLETMERFAAAEYSVYAMDLRGHGRSSAVPGDLEGLDNVVEDIHLLTLRAREEAPGAPVVLLGHSMGGLLALNQLLFYQQDYDLAIASAASLLPPENAGKLAIALAGFLAKVAPRLPLSPLEKKVFTRNQEMVARDDADDLLYHGGFRARTGHELLQAQLRLSKRLSEITLPVLALHGGDDLVMSPKATDILVAKIGSADKTQHLFPGLYHEILNEPERDEVFRVMFQWLDERLRP